MNLVYSVEGEPLIDQAVVHDWYPFNEGGERALEEIPKPRFVALGHHPLDPDRFSPEASAESGERFLFMDRTGERWEIPHSGR